MNAHSTAYTNGTLVDQAFCDADESVSETFLLSITLEGFEDANDLRRGAGVYEKVLARNGSAPWQSGSDFW